MTRVLILIAMLVAAPVAAQPSKLVVVTDQAIILRDQIYFEYGKPVIKSQSFQLLDAVVATLKADPKLALVEIQAHTDERGNDQWNLEISEKRAQAVYKYLVDRGVPGKRLRAKGYGETQPIDKAHNEKAWAQNRRIELRILQRITS